MKIAVIDMDSVAFSIGHPNKVLDALRQPMRTEDGSKFLYQDKTEHEMRESADFIMNDILTNGGFTHYIAYIKGKNTIHNKLSVNSDYKQDRTGGSPVWWNFVKQDVIDRWNVVQVDNLEVDDACNITRLKIADSYLCCIDNDLLGLEGKHYNWRKNEWISVTKQQELNKFWTEMIAGGHNNTKGIPKKGPAYASKIFNGIKKYDYDHSIIVYKEFIDYFGVDLGIKEFYKNYICCQTMINYEGFVIPEPIEYKRDIKLRVDDDDGGGVDVDW